MTTELFLSEIQKVLSPEQFMALKRMIAPKCTTARMIYILTYRALREFASGRKSTNPIEALHIMETSVPFSICSKTHDTMMLAQRSFNQRFLAPVGVHETDVFHYNTPYPMRCQPPVETSLIRYLNSETIHTRLTFMRNRAYAHRVNGFWDQPLKRIDLKYRALHNPLFA